MVNDLIAGIAQRLGLPLGLNEDGAGRLVFEENIRLLLAISL